MPGALTVLLRPHSLGYAARAAEDRRASLLLDASNQGTPVNSQNVATNEERPFYTIFPRKQPMNVEIAEPERTIDNFLDGLPCKALRGSTAPASRSRPRRRRAGSGSSPRCRPALRSRSR